MSIRNLDAMAHAECKAVEAAANERWGEAAQHYRDAMEQAFLAGWTTAAQRLRHREREMTARERRLRELATRAE